MQAEKTIAIGCDHAGFEYKEAVKKRLGERGYSIKDFGTYSEDSVDYPDFARPLAASVASGENKSGILICGSGNGVCMTANKNPQIRAALCWTEELGKLARLHNDANVLCLPSRFIDLETAWNITAAFLDTEFEGGRHQKRVSKISA
jgi:ribose 5-phosphate isomerase B